MHPSKSGEHFSFAKVRQSMKQSTKDKANLLPENYDKHEWIPAVSIEPGSEEQP
jgi:hypothetical protein